MMAASVTSATSSGQSTAELAVLLPLLMILALTVVQVGVVARDYVAIHHSVQEAARMASLEPTRDPDRAAVANPANLEPERLQVDLDGGRSTGDLLTVKVQYRSPTAVPIVGAFIDDIDLSAAAVVRVE